MGILLQGRRSDADDVPDAIGTLRTEAREEPEEYLNRGVKVPGAVEDAMEDLFTSRFDFGF